MPKYSSPRYKRPRKLNRPSKTLKCRFDPNRTVARLYSPSSIGRVTCAAIRRGVRKGEIDREVQRRCGVGAPQCDCERALLTLRHVLTVAASVIIMLGIINGLALVPFLLLQRIPILGRLIAGQLLRRLSSETSAIEGVFVRVRQEVTLIERELAREYLPRP